MNNVLNGNVAFNGLGKIFEWGVCQEAFYADREKVVFSDKTIHFNNKTFYGGSLLRKIFALPIKTSEEKYKFYRQYISAPPKSYRKNFLVITCDGYGWAMKIIEGHKNCFPPEATKRTETTDVLQ